MRTILQNSCHALYRFSVFQWPAAPRIFGRPFVKRFALCYQTVVCPVLSVCNVRALWPNGWMDQDGTWHAGRSRPRTYCVRWGPSSPPPKGHSSQFSAHICRGQMAAWIKITLGTEVGLSPGDFVLDGDPPLHKNGRSPQFSAHVHCGHTAGWIKTALDKEVGHSPGYFVLDGDPAPPQKRGWSPPIFGPCLLRPNGGMDQDATWYEGRPRPRRHCVRCGPSSPSPKWGQSPFPNFRPMSTKRLDGSR